MSNRQSGQIYFLMVTAPSSSRQRRGIFFFNRSNPFFSVRGTRAGRAIRLQDYRVIQIVTEMRPTGLIFKWAQKVFFCVAAAAQSDRPLFNYYYHIASHYKLLF